MPNVNRLSVCVCPGLYISCIVYATLIHKYICKNSLPPLLTAITRAPDPSLTNINFFVYGFLYVHSKKLKRFCFLKSNYDHFKGTKCLQEALKVYTCILFARVKSGFMRRLRGPKEK